MFTISISLFFYMCGFYLIALKKHKYSVVDIAWPFGFILVVLINYFQSPSLHKSIGLILITIWALRLGIYLIKRSSGGPEDPRYAELRKKWGKVTNLKAFFYIFLFQGALIYFFSFPAFFHQSQNNTLSWLNFLGLFIWALGFGLEAYSDYFLSQFKSNSKNNGKLCTEGPWRICRYPNYLGEITLWYGIYLFYLTQDNWWTIFAPIGLNFLIVKVTGIPPQEERHLKRADYQNYASRVPRLFPFISPKILK